MQILDQIPRESLPRVIFFDAMGTLFDLKNSVGEIYHQYASKHGVAIDAKQIEQAFITSFKSAPPLAFLPNELAVIKQQEFDWWKQVVSATFEQLEVLENFVDFNAFLEKYMVILARKNLGMYFLILLIV